MSNKIVTFPAKKQVQQVEIEEPMSIFMMFEIMRVTGLFTMFTDGVVDNSVQPGPEDT